MGNSVVHDSSEDFPGVNTVYMARESFRRHLYLEESWRSHVSVSRAALFRKLGYLQRSLTVTFKLDRKSPWPTVRCRRESERMVVIASIIADWYVYDHTTVHRSDTLGTAATDFARRYHLRVVHFLAQVTYRQSVNGEPLQNG